VSGPSGRVLLVGPLPPPPTGQSVAFGLLAEGLGDGAEVVDIAERTSRRDKAFSPARALGVLAAALRAFRAAGRCRVVYLTIAQSRLGFLRDALILGAAFLRGRPTVVHLHGGNYPGFRAGEPAPVRRLISAVLGRVDRLVVLSEGLRDQFAFLGPGRQARVRVVPNPCPVPVGPPRPAPGEAVTLLFLSNLLVAKGYLDCVEALALLRRRAPERRWRLVLAGAFALAEDGYADLDEARRALASRVDALGLGGAVEVAGVVAGAAKADALARADVFLLPTRYSNEGQPISALEAMASGLPVVATRWRGLAEMVEDGADGVFVPPSDPSAIADAVLRIAGDAAAYERLSAGATRKAAAFSPEAHLGAMRAVLAEAEAARR